jgi:glycosyltransferase involved in cell wall biosynthesis
VKLAFIYGLWSSAQHRFDFDALWDSPRGLTGSEVSCFSIAREMVKRGHDVTIFTGLKPGSDKVWDGVKLVPVEDIPSAITAPNDRSDWHAAYSWNEPDPLRPIHWSVIRMCNLQINSFNHCQPGYDDFVDVWTSPSDSHRKVVGATAPNPQKWIVVPNGCDPSSVVEDERVPGRVIWASSPDRGLHHLLQVWPQVKAEVPEASLRIFYHVDRWINHFTNVDTRVDPSYPEFAARAFYLQEAIRRIVPRKDLSVEIFDSVSRKRMAKEMAVAQVLGYPCDTVLYTEGFSATIMESCCAGVLPVVTDQDAFGEVYGGHVPMVKSPVGPRINEYRDLLVRALKDDGFRSEWLAKTKALSTRYTWQVIAEDVEKQIVAARTSRGWSC